MAPEIMTPDEHIEEATRLLGEAEAFGVDGGFDPTRMMAAQVHVQIAMYQRASQMVDHAVDPPAYTVDMKRVPA